MKKLVLILGLMAGYGASFAQTRADYDRELARFTAFYNSGKCDSMYNMCSSKVKGMIPPDKYKTIMDGTKLQLGELKSTEYEEKKKGANYYKGTFANATLTIILLLNAEHKMEDFRFIPYSDIKPGAPGTPVETTNLIYKSGTGDIKGTLRMPQKTGKVPVVLIIAGSGPTDRDCNSEGMQTNAYKMLADSLEKAGIASLRYDKRGVGESADALKKEEDLRFEDMINDASGFAKMLKNDSRFSKVYILGHSEGSAIGMIAAQKTQADGYISVAGIAERADKVVELQIAETSKELAAKAKVLLDSLAAGFDVKNIDNDLMSLLRPSIQPYMKSWLKYNPAKEIAKLKIPVLIVQGTTDIQVGKKQAEMLKKANPKSQLVMVEGMSHILKDGPADRAKNIETYNKPDLPLSSGFVASLVKFLK